MDRSSEILLVKNLPRKDVNFLRNVLINTCREWREGGLEAAEKAFEIREQTETPLPDSWSLFYIPGHLTKDGMGENMFLFGTPAGETFFRGFRSGVFCARNKMTNDRRRNKRKKG